MSRTEGRRVPCCGRVVPHAVVDGVVYPIPHGCVVPPGHPELELSERDEQALRDLDDGLDLDDDELSRLVDVHYARLRRRRGYGAVPELTPQGRERLRYLIERDARA